MMDLGISAVVKGNGSEREIGDKKGWE